MRNRVAKILADRLSMLLHKQLMHRNRISMIVRAGSNLAFSCDMVHSPWNWGLHALCDCSIIRRLPVLNKMHTNCTHESSCACDRLEKPKVCPDSSLSLSVIGDLLNVDTNSLINKQWITMCNEEFLKNFKVLSCYAVKNNVPLSDPKFNEIWKFLSNKLADLNDDELQHLLICIAQWISTGKYSTPRYLVEAIDNNCYNRIKKWDADKILHMNELLIRLNLAKILKFAKHSLRKLNFEEMTSNQLVRYAACASSKKHLDVDLDDFEHHIVKCAHNLTLDELAVIAILFFKHEAQIKSDNLLERMMKMLMAEINTISDNSLSSILKTLRYSNNFRFLSDMEVLTELLIDQVDRMKVKTLTHVALLLTTILIENKHLLLKIVNKFSNEIRETRIKDIERIMLSLYMMNYGPETTDFYSIAAGQLLETSRKEEFGRFPLSFVYTVLYMMQMNFYPKGPLEYIMSSDFLEAVYDPLSMHREYLTLDYCIEIDHPEYQGPRLPKSTLKTLLMKCGALSNQSQRCDDLPRVDHGTKLMIDVMHVCKQIVKLESAVHADYLLPYTSKKQIVFCQDPRTREFLPICDKLLRIPVGKIKYAPKDGRKWFALLIGSHNFVTRNTMRPTGALAIQMRHLQRLGYVPILIRHSVWSGLKDMDEKKSFITSLMS